MLIPKPQNIFQSDRFLNTFLNEKLPSAIVGLFGTDFDGNSGGIEFLPIKLFNILPATLKTEIFLARAKSVDDSVVIFLAFGSISGISGFCKHKKILISILSLILFLTTYQMYLNLSNGLY